MTRKITIIGAGNVGSTIGYTIATKRLASEVLFIDIAQEKAAAEALDIYQATPVNVPIKISSGEYKDAVDSDIVVITSGVARKPGQNRLDLAKTNVGIIKSIAKEIVQYAPHALYIIVSNPVDVLTYAFTKVSGIPESRIIGSGTLLDSARLKATLSQKLGINQKNVHAYVLGEHGDSSFVPWSMANVAGMNLVDFAKNGYAGKSIDLDYDEIIEYVHKSGGAIIKGKGSTTYAIAASVCHIIESISSADNTVAAVSTLMHGEYGIDGVCLSVPCVLGPDGVKGKIIAGLTEEEQEKLRQSAEALRVVQDQSAVD